MLVECGGWSKLKKKRLEVGEGGTLYLRGANLFAFADQYTSERKTAPTCHDLRKFMVGQPTNKNNDSSGSVYPKIDRRPLFFWP